MNFIGEKMSEYTLMEGMIELPNGDIFQNEVDMILDRPLSVGQLLYAKLRRMLPDDIQVEVYWNHFDDVITATIAGRETESIVSFHEMQMARVDKVEHINQLVDRIREAFLSH